MINLISLLKIVSRRPQIVTPSLRVQNFLNHSRILFLILIFSLFYLQLVSPKWTLHSPLRLQEEARHPLTIWKIWPRTFSIISNSVLPNHMSVYAPSATRQLSRRNSSTNTTTTEWNNEFGRFDSTVATNVALGNSYVKLKRIFSVCLGNRDNLNHETWWFSQIADTRNRNLLKRVSPQTVYKNPLTSWSPSWTPPMWEMWHRRASCRRSPRIKRILSMLTLKGWRRRRYRSKSLKRFVQVSNNHWLIDIF